ncbi:bifunctional 5,10-methylenetetrahydrofolate dehydrogenase/5,10-methenyltetrahydrofolate cyclohydrolase [Patescibacteria group bacterium]
MKIISGKEISENILDEIRKDITAQELNPGLAVILVGNDEASHIYVNLKEKAAKEVGINFFKFLFNEDTDEELILKKIEELNGDDEVHGIIVQLPLPGNLDTQKIINSIDPEKDVDGFHPENIKAFFEDKNEIVPVFPSAIMKMVNFAFGDAGGNSKEAIVVVNSDRFGDAMTCALSRSGFNSKYIFCDDVLSEKPDGELINFLRRADVVVTACGSLDLIDRNMIKDGAVVIDGGVIKENKQVFGDVDYDSFLDSDCQVSPVPGGVGPVTVACLLENVYLMSLK